MWFFTIIMSCLIIFISLSLFLKVLWALHQTNCNSKVCLVGKVALVTGGSDGEYKIQDFESLNYFCYNEYIFFAKTRYCFELYGTVMPSQILSQAVKFRTKGMESIFLREFL